MKVVTICLVMMREEERKPEEVQKEAARDVDDVAGGEDEAAATAVAVACACLLVHLIFVRHAQEDVGIDCLLRGGVVQAAPLITCDALAYGYDGAGGISRRFGCSRRRSGKR